MIHRPTFYAAILFSIAILITLACLFTPMEPLPRGTSDAFWSCGCMVDLSSRGYLSGTALIQDGTAYYCVTGYDGNTVYALPESEAMKDYPRVIAELEHSPAGQRKTAYLRWKAFTPASQNDVQGLLDAMHEARLENTIESLAGQYVGASDYWELQKSDLSTQAEKSRHYWANFVFEALFFITLIWFILWPALRRAPLWRWLFHAALTPFLLLLPLWLGYCIMTRSPWGPTGGIIYPYTIMPFQFLLRDHGNWQWEFAFFRAMPKLFGPLSQGIWEPAFMEGRLSVPQYTPGTFHALLAAASLCLLIILENFAKRQWVKLKSRPKPRGFDVITQQPHP